MRKIVCLRIATKQLDELILEECCQHSYLVEPVNEHEVLVDLSTFKQIGAILAGITDVAGRDGGDGIYLGLAISPLLATLAANRCSQSLRKSSCYRSFIHHGVRVMQVIPGKEAEFLRSLPIKEFYPLSVREQKLLTRMGYTSMGEFADLTPTRMKEMLKRDAALLWQNCHGIDYTPVRGIYPADQLVDSVTFPEGCRDAIRIQKVCQDVSLALAAVLEKRWMACHQVRVEILTLSGCHIWERTLAQACHQGNSLAHVVQNLMQMDQIQSPVEELRVVLQDLEQVKMQDLNLFTLRRDTRDEERKMRMQDIVEQMQEQYPDCFQVGLSLNRRDQILALWDPWRISPGGNE